MIVVGAGIILFGFGNGGIATGISNLWSHGGWFPNGFSGLLPLHANGAIRLFRR